MTELFLLEQTLHGYERGHRLLAGSLPIGGEDDRAMLTMSDLSGSRVVEGFLEYLTGYMLPSNSYFVLARTWYASEMKRPGCVWTHSLLIPPNVLKTIRNAEALMPLYKRPSLDPAFRYSQRLEVPSAAFRDVDCRGLNLPPSEAICILEELYSANDGSVGVAITSGSAMEPFVLGLWSQLWPELRSNFWFCSGSLSLRSLSGRPLDLQCGPARVRRELDTMQPLPCQEERWSGTILEDLLHPGLFREFLRKNDPGLNNRTAMAAFAKIYTERATGDFEEALRIVADAFPLENQALELKRSALCDVGDAVDQVELRNLLHLLSKPAFASASSHLAVVLKTLAKRNPRKLAQCLEAGSDGLSSGFVTLLIGVLADSFSQSDFEWASEAMPNIFNRLLVERPAVAYQTSFWNWNLSVFEKVDIFQLLLRQPGVDNAALFLRLFASADQELLSRLVSHLTAEQLPQVLQWIQSHERAATRVEWTSYLAKHQKEFVVWLNDVNNPNLQTVILAANVLNTPPPLHTVLTDAAIERLALGVSSLPNDRHEVAAFLFVTTAWVSNPVLTEIFVDSFISLHRAIASNRLSSRAWHLITPMLTPLPDAQWDSCEKLRRTALYFIARNQWDCGILSRYLVSDIELFYDFTRTAKSYGEGREFMAYVYDASHRGDFALQKKQTKELRKLLGKSS